MRKILPLLYFHLLVTYGAAQSFIPKDTILAKNVFQVEFSPDGRSMVWCENLTGGLAKVWYTDVNLDSGLPDFAKKQLIDTISGQGWPYWGQDRISKFFLIKNKAGRIIYIRRTGINSLTPIDLGLVNGDDKSLLNVSSDSTKNYFWVSYIIKNRAQNGLDSLFAFRSDQPTRRVFIDAEKKNQSGSAYELTFPRWLAQSELLAYPFRPITNQPYWDIKFWNGEKQKSSVVTNDIVASIFNHHVDDLPFKLPQFPADTFMFSSRAAQRVVIYKKAGQYFQALKSFVSPTRIAPPTLTSFEPFTVCGNKTYGAYQVYPGGGIPGTTAGEIYLLSIFGDSLHTKISTFDGDVAVDPEFVVGRTKVWIFYYGKPTGIGNFNLHRCETPIHPNCLTTSTSIMTAGQTIRVYPNPFRNQLALMNSTGQETVQLTNALGQLIWKGNNLQDQDFSPIQPGIYFATITQSDGSSITKKLLKN